MKLDTLHWRLRMAGIYSECATADEVSWVQEQLSTMVENEAEARLDEIEEN